MRLRKVTLNNFILFWLVILPIYQDSPLSVYLGVAGYTFVMPLSLILIVLYVLFTNKIPKNKYLVQLVKLGIWMTIISFLAIIIWVALGNSMTIVSEFLPIKALKVCMQYFSYPSYVALTLIMVRRTGTESIGRYSFFALIVLTVICFIEMQQLPYAFESLHFTGKFPYWRIRLLTIESSWTAMMIFIYSFLAIYWGIVYQKKARTVIGIICTIYLFWMTGSRSLMMMLPMMIIVYVFLVFSNLSKRSITMLVVASIGMIFFVQLMLPQVTSSFQIDIENYTSLATRLYTGILGLFIGIIYPVGVGGAVYLAVFQSALSKYLWIFSKLPIRLNTSEVMGLANSHTDVALTVKSGIFHNNMYWGILGTVYLFRNFRGLSGEIFKSAIKYKDMLLAAFWTTILLLVFASDFSFEFWLFYTFMICINEEQERRDFYVQ